ncbi:MAG: peptidoglycan glycosyltransferase/peptidoglycan DD-transpeptidase MrcA [Enterobacteriaceae bacterium]
MKLVKYLIVFVIGCMLLGVASLFALYNYFSPQLPDVATLKEVRLQTPMLIYSADNKLIAQYGEKRRIPLSLQQLPPQMIDAFIAIEDNRFYEHHGVDPVGIARAFMAALHAGQATQGASTITQQLARNFFLSPEKTLSRKLKEVFLAIRIEQLLSKEEILELYLNKIYLGHRAYGVGAAAQVYFGKSVDQLTLSEMAMIAGLPKAPSVTNPLTSPERALARRNTVLMRMWQENYINEQAYQQARNEPVKARYHVPEIDFSAPYFTEMVRQEMVQRYGENAYTDGYKVFTTITEPLQQAAQKAVQDNVIHYDMRHGYRGPEKVLWQSGQPPWDQQRVVQHLKQAVTYGPLHPAIVTQVNEESATALLANGHSVTLPFSHIRWARHFISDVRQGALPKKPADVLQVGQQIRVREEEQQWWLAQLPQVNSALVSIDSNDGAILALVGGFDFGLSKFNRATQALRQIGSNIKPFIYAAALDKGMTLASVLNDLPITRWDVAAGSDWRPKNSPPTYDGPIRIRQALGQSKNVVMVRTMRAIGVNYAADFMTRFGFPSANMMRTESLALGSPSFTPLELVRGYAVFPNGGFFLDPYFITRIEDDAGNVVFTAKGKIACPKCNLPVIYGETEKNLANIVGNPELEEPHSGTDAPVSPAILLPAGTQSEDYAPHVISTPLAFLISDALRTDIFGESGGRWMGTGWRAARDLKRSDIGGKTGTTNSSKDAWFSGYGAHIATTVWIGFDDHRRTLGSSSFSGVFKDQISGGEGGAKSAQPAWNDFMKAALNGVPEEKETPPEGIISVLIDRYTGGLASDASQGKPEFFIKGTEPTAPISSSVGTQLTDDGDVQELF